MTVVPDATLDVTVHLAVKSGLGRHSRTMNIPETQGAQDAFSSPYSERTAYIYPANISARSAVWTREMRAALITETEGPID